MKIGKLDWDDLKQIIDENKSVKRNDVRIRSGIGEDCSVINFGEYECVVSTDPITGANKNLGKLAFNINCNDIASCGAEPVGILVTIMVPESASLQDIKDIMAEIDLEAKKNNVEILGGHTEVTNAVNKIVVSCAVIGKSLKGKAVSTSGAQVGDDIIVTKKLCIEGTIILVNDHYDTVKKILTDDEIEKVHEYSKQLSVIKEGRIAGNFGVNSMHDITEGGVLGALWEIAQGSDVGFRVYKDKMPISDITYKLCKNFNIDPLKFISSGSMIITTKKGKELIDEFKKAGIEAFIIGEVTQKNKVIVDDGKEFIVESPKEDELFKIN